MRFLAGSSLPPDHSMDRQPRAGHDSFPSRVRRVRMVALVAVLAVPALADILPDEVALCRGKGAGASCTTGDGQSGTCVETSVSRPDYSGGIPPKYTPVKMLACVAAAKGSARVALPWVGVGLAFLAMLAAFVRKPRGHAPSPA